MCLLFRVLSCVHVPKQLLMLLRSLSLFIFLLPDFTLDVLTEHCTHRLFVFASTAANYIETIAAYASLLQYEFWVYCKIHSRIKPFLQIQRNIGKIVLVKIIIVIYILFQQTNIHQRKMKLHSH